MLEAKDAFGEGVQVGELGRFDGLALQDGEEDLDLVQPGGVDGQVDRCAFGLCPMTLLLR